MQRGLQEETQAAFEFDSLWYPRIYFAAAIDSLIFNKIMVWCDAELIFVGSYFGGVEIIVLGLNSYRTGTVFFLPVEIKVTGHRESVWQCV